jgi:hypothetical protein
MMNNPEGNTADLNSREKLKNERKDLKEIKDKYKLKIA